ncbi:hypothetical protein ACB092_12G188900 [Castanea dentata]
MSILRELVNKYILSDCKSSLLGCLFHPVIYLSFCLSFCFQKGMLVFDAAQFDGILKKITEFNNALLSDLFAVIDILRMTVLHPDGAIVLLKLVEAENEEMLESTKLRMTSSLATLVLWSYWLHLLQYTHLELQMTQHVL